MGSESDTEQKVHVLFFPLPAQGHLLPTLDMAKLFAARGAKSTVITTTHNASIFTKPIDRARSSGLEIDLKIIRFPGPEVGLPEGLENLDAVASQDNHCKFFAAIGLLHDPVEQLVRELHPHGLVADMFFPWAEEIAARHRIPRLMFHGTSFFSMCAMDCIETHKPHMMVSSDSEPFVLPGLPDRIEMTKLQIPDHHRLGFENDFTRLMNRGRESMKRSFGVIVNSFYELEPAYADHYRNVLGRKAWHIGPVSLSNKEIEDKAQRGDASAGAGDHNCLKWLDSKKPNSVVYVCFGTTSRFSDAQLLEIAAGLESSGQEFIWVVRKDKNRGETGDENWLPEGYEERIGGKGLIIRGWVPQVLILDHAAVGGFVTHCGWNSTLEGVSAGLPLVTWPVFAEQFYNEKLVTEVLRVGVGVGVRQWVRLVGDFVKSEAVERAVKEIMVGERAEEMRNRARALGEMAKRAVEEGGSSYNDLGSLIQELRAYGGA